MSLPRRRRPQPIVSSVSMKLDGCRAYAASIAAAEIAVLSVSEKVQSSARKRETESKALTHVYYGVAYLTPEQALALKLEIQGKQDRATNGRTRANGLSGGALLEWIASAMRGRGYPDATAGSVKQLLVQCDQVLELVG